MLILSIGKILFALKCCTEIEMGIFTFLFGKSTTPNPGGGSTKIVSRGNKDTGRVSHDRFNFSGDSKGTHNHESYTYNRDSGKTRECSGPNH